MSNNNGDDDVIEPAWLHDQVVMPNITQSCSNEFDVPRYDTVLANQNQLQQQQHLNPFLQEDEMISWLHYPFPDTNFSNFLSTSTSLTHNNTTSSELNVTSSSAELVIPQNPCVENDRKRKGKEKELECHTQLESAEAKPSHGSAKRSRVAEVHNESERRRRGRINQKLEALRELIPNSNKLDKASLLEEAIKYITSLQMQLQMMSMVHYMVPAMFPRVPQYVPLMMMAMNRPIMPLPSAFVGASSSTSLPVAAGTTHSRPSFSMSSYQIPPITSHNASTTQSPPVSKC